MSDGGTVLGEGFEEGPSEGLRQELVPARLLRGPRELEGYLRREVGALSAELLRAGSTAAVQRKRPDGRGRGRVRARPAPAPECQSLRERLSRPTLVVVPSRSLREHLSQSLLAAAGAGGAFLGLRILTLEALAREVLDRAGLPCVDSPLHALQVRRLAAGERALADALGAFEDGYQAVAAVVDDLLDAGLEPAHAEFLQERIAELSGVEGAMRARLAALVRVAAQTSAQPHASGRAAAHRSVRLARARSLIEADPASALPARRLFVAGFQDATGVQADLLETLVRVCAAEVLFEHPADPLHGPHDATHDGGWGRFGERLRARLAGIAGLQQHEAHCAPTQIEVVRAPDREAEVRALACQLRALLDAGASPERIGVVARDLAPYRAVLRRQLFRASVPFSGCGEPGLAGPARIRLDALLALLERRGRSGIECWLDAHALPRDDGARAAAFARQAALRRALHRRGCVQLRDLARLAPDAAVSADSIRAAAALLERLEAMGREARLDEHAGDLLALAEDALGWERTDAQDLAQAALEALLTSPGFSAAGSARLAFEEFAGVLRRALREAGLGALGGGGGGVQVLGVMEARSRSFEVLFVLGLNRGLFPRAVSEDPFLPDALRGALRDVLPELPVKAEGHDEDRYLFAQLLAAAPRVVLSCAAEDAEGRPLTPSPLLERLVDTGAVQGQRVWVREAQPLHAPVPGALPRPPAEHALLAGLAGGWRAQGPLWSSVLGSADAGANARGRVVRELDAYRGPRGALGPYFGFTAPLSEREPPPVTFLEAVLRCPWSAYLRRILRLGPAPDALGALPRVDTEFRLLGDVVHRTLDRIVGAQLREGTAPAGGPHPGGSPDAVDGAHPVVWPEAPVVARALEESAVLCLERAEIRLPGYARVLARRAAPYLESARMDFGPGPLAVVGVEWEGRARLEIEAGRSREVRFRADRVDRVGGRLRLTDYKTGRARLPKRADAEKLLEVLAQKQQLQAVVYAAAEPGAEGRYLFLHPEERERERRVALDAVPLPASLARAVDAAFAVADTGAFIPRLRMPDEDREPEACRRCEVKDACIRGDSGARGRLARYMESAGAGAGSDALAAAANVWRLGAGR